MKGFLIRWLVNIIALVAVVKIIPGIHSDMFATTVVAALMLGLINAFLRPALLIVTLPLTVVSFGLFTLVINGLMFYLVSKIVAGFAIANFWSAFWGALVFSIISFLLNLFINPQGKFKIYSYSHSRRAGHPLKDTNVIDTEAKIEDIEDEEEDGER